jgi:hypothetical protein
MLGVLRRLFAIDNDQYRSLRAAAQPRIRRADAHAEPKQITGWCTMIDEILVMPFETTVLGAAVIVERVDLDSRDQIVAI